MKRSMTLLVLSVGFLLVATNSTVGQTETLGGGARPSQEQSLQELVNEVRQLRAMLQRVSTTVYKTNVVVERLKFQQELVARHARELNEAREQLDDARVQVAKAKEAARRGEVGLEEGLLNPKEVTALKLELDALVQREMRLVQRETHLTNDLSIERSKLMELNDQLNKLELELPRP